MQVKVSAQAKVVDLWLAIKIKVRGNLMNRQVQRDTLKVSAQEQHIQRMAQERSL